MEKKTTMKKYFILLILTAITLISNTNFKLNAQTYNQNDLSKLIAFLELPSSNPARTNAALLEIGDLTNPETWNPNLITTVWSDESTNKRIKFLEFSLESTSNTKLSGKLDLSSCDSLTTLYCSENEITELVLTGCSSLKYLLCNNNSLERLDLINLTELKILVCKKNRLTQLNLSGSNNIQQLYCNDNDLKELELTNLEQLEIIKCQNNSISELNLFNCRELTMLDCQNNSLIFRLLRMPVNFEDMKARGITDNFAIGRQKPFIPVNFEKFGSSYLSRGLLIDLKTIGAGDFAWFRASNLNDRLVARTHYAENAPGEFVFYTNTGLINTPLLCEMENNSTHLDMLVPTVEFTLAYIYNRNDVEKLRNFLQQGDNGRKVNPNYDNTDPTTFNVTWTARRNNDTTEYRVTRIVSWTEKGIEGDLDLTGCDFITDIDVESNRLTNLTFGNQTIIRQLNCGRNLLTQLNLQPHIELLDLKCHNNRITELNLMRNTLLETFDCRNNEDLVLINLDGLTRIRMIYCDNNKLQNLDVYNLENLERLTCDNNRIQKLATSYLRNLEIFSATNNNIDSLDFTAARNLRTVNVENNQLLRFLNLTSLENVSDLSCQNNSLDFRTLKMPARRPLTRLVLHPQDTIGRELFNRVGDIWISRDNVIDLSNYADNATTFTWKRENGNATIATTNNAVFEIPAQYEGQIVYCELSSSTNFPNLILSTVKFRAEYRYSENDVTKLRAFLNDTSKFGITNGRLLSPTYNSDDPATFPVVWKLFGSIKYLSEINWSNQSDLRGTLDLSNCINLEKINLSCSDNTRRNAITSLILAGCANITSVEVRFNQLTELNLTGCNNLEILDCSNNRITSLTITSKALTQVNVSFNLLVGNLNLADNKKLVELNCANNELTALVIAGCDELKRLNCPFNQLTILNLESSTKLVELNCANNELENINVTNLPNLHTLNCSNNKIKSLDVSQCTEIVSLRCINNELEILDLRGKFITELFAYNNSLTFPTILFDKKPNELLLQPQATIVPDNLDSDFVLQGDTLDLARFGEIEKDITTYEFKFLNGDIVSTSDYGTAGNGKFTNFARELRGRTIYCEMTNPEFPDLILRTIRFALTAPERYNENDVNRLQAFLQQSVKNGGNIIGRYLNSEYDVNKPETFAVTWLPIDGEMRVVSINWEDKPYLNGKLDLTDCEYLEHLACTGISSSRSGISEVVVNGCTRLEYIDISYNEVSKLSTSNTSAIVTMNCSNNKLDSINLSHLATSLSTLNCSNNNLTFATTNISKAPENFVWEPQSDVVPFEVTAENYGQYSIKTKSINLYDFGADHYRWQTASGLNINLTGNNGFFSLSETLIGQKIYCTMTSSENKFADLELHTVEFLVDFDVSVAETHNSFDLIIYPNPTSNDANILINFDDTEHGSDLEITMYDMQGANLGVLYSGDYRRELKINFASFSTGSYFLLFRTAGKQVTKSINIIK